MSSFSLRLPFLMSSFFYVFLFLCLPLNHFIFVSVICLTDITRSGTYINNRIVAKRGTNRKSINPITDPMPWILDAVITISFDSFTLKKHVKIQAPIANIAIKDIIVYVSPPETGWYYTAISYAVISIRLYHIFAHLFI